MRSPPICASVSHDLRDPMRRRPRVFVLPNPDHAPADSPQPAVGVAVASLVVRELALPVLRIRHCSCCVLRTTVPETSIHEHCDSSRSEHDVRSSTYTRDDRTVEAVTQAKPMKLASKGEFWIGVSLPHALHASAGICRRGRRDAPTFLAPLAHDALLARSRTSPGTGVIQSAGGRGIHPWLG